MRLFRGMSEREYQSRQGLSRKGSDSVTESYTTDDGYTSDTQSNTGTGSSVGTAQLLHTYCSRKNKGAFLSFSESFEVAAWYSLQARWRTGTKGIVVETNTALLRELSIGLGPNPGAFAWEEEVTLVLDKYVVLPDAAVDRVHTIDCRMLRKCASSLSQRWPGILRPAFLEVFDQVD